MITSRERDLAHQLEAGPDHSVLPEEDDLAAGRRRRRPDRTRSARAVCSGQPSVANGQSADENHVSSTSSSRCRSPRAALGARVGLRLRAPSCGRRGSTRSGSWWPHQSWREMFHGRIVLEPVRERHRRAAARAWSARDRRASAAIAGFASSSIAHHHWSEHERLDARRPSGRSGRPRAGSSRASRAGRAPAATRARARRPRPCVSPASSPARPHVMRPSRPITVGSSRPWSRPISKSVGSCPGVIFSAPVPNSGSTRSSAITGTCRSTNGHDHLAADQRPGSARRRDGRPRRRRRGSSPAAPSRS